MFTGIVQGIAALAEVTVLGDITRWRVDFPSGALDAIQVGASVSLNGCCLTVTSVTANSACFDLVDETLQRTLFGNFKPGTAINYERSLRFGDEVGGHILSGHIDFVATIIAIKRFEHSRILTFRVPPSSESETGMLPWIHYIFEKGYIGINGASLTVTRVDHDRGEFDVSLIPETLQKTTFSNKEVGETVTIEIDRNTQVIVDTVRRMGLRAVP